ncbi:MAG: DUF2185 domain-containing protein [Oscillospiraceae bacterium]|jgi:hypothetical protein|nr:DUF2185 domain-containing protein [Oscillospiraceae bacterium]
MQETLTTYLYTQEEEAAATQAIEARFGKVSQVLREVVSRDIRVDLCVVAPEPGRAYQTVVTRGMGARAMRAPEDAQAVPRAELVFMLPEGWELRSRDECWYWPLRWLKLLARLPAEEDSWLGWGHTVPGGEPFAENTDFDSLLLLDAFTPRGEPCFTLPGGQAVRFYQLFPLYGQELQFKLKHGAQALVDRMAAGNALSPVLDTARPNLFPPAPPEKRCRLQKHQLRPLLLGWDGPTGCLATDRILVEGAPVGYCYREDPCGDWDSGWRFTAGDESDEYMQNPRHSDIYTLNCLANYDSGILPILSTEAPCAFALGEAGLERLKNIT